MEEEHVNHPKHYQSTSIECIDAMTMTFGPEINAYACLWNAYKYLWRYRDKNGKEDVEKAEWYIAEYEDIRRRYNFRFTSDIVKHIDDIHAELVYQLDKAKKYYAADEGNEESSVQS